MFIHKLISLFLGHVILTIPKSMLMAYFSFPENLRPGPLTLLLQMEIQN